MGDSRPQQVAAQAHGRRRDGRRPPQPVGRRGGRDPAGRLESHRGDQQDAHRPAQPGEQPADGGELPAPGADPGEHPDGQQPPQRLGVAHDQHERGRGQRGQPDHTGDRRGAETLPARQLGKRRHEGERGQVHQHDQGDADPGVPTEPGQHRDRTHQQRQQGEEPQALLAGPGVPVLGDTRVPAGVPPERAGQRQPAGAHASASAAVRMGGPHLPVDVVGQRVRGGGRHTRGEPGEGDLTQRQLTPPRGPPGRPSRAPPRWPGVLIGPASTPAAADRRELRRPPGGLPGRTPRQDGTVPPGRSARTMRAHAVSGHRHTDSGHRSVRPKIHQSVPAATAGSAAGRSSPRPWPAGPVP